jgi:hypothetical protein
VISQLTISTLAQNKEAMELNNLCHQEIECQTKNEETKKDRTNKIHASIIKMFG